MRFSLFYFDEVKYDVRDAKAWYRKQKDGLEKHFAEEVKKCIGRLHTNPFAYEIKFKNIRTAFTEVFPHAIHFYIYEANYQI